MACSVEHGGSLHKCSESWSHESIFKVSEVKIKSVRDRNVVEREDTEERYTFAAFHPVTDNISMPESFFMGKWQKPRIWLTGRGRTIVEAEETALKRMGQVAGCDHRFRKADDGMTGDATCMRCNVFVSELFLNPDIHYAKYNSLSQHGESEVEPGIKLRNHLSGMTTEMSFDPHLATNQKIDLLCAGWMHHADGIPSKNNSEKILKYFHLDPSGMRESLLLSYYDTVDMIRHLLSTDNHEALSKYAESASAIMGHMKNTDLPHSGFLESYILMVEQKFCAIKICGGE